MNKNTEIIDIPKYERKLYLTSNLASIGIIILASIFFSFNELAAYSLMILLLIFVLFGIDYYIKKDKVVLSLGNSFIDKHQDFRLTDNIKLIDKLRLLIELNLEESEILERFKEFLSKNHTNQYKKIYVVGPNSYDDITTISNIINGTQSNEYK
jgi:Ca2+/Na+ antiporter